MRRWSWIAILALSIGASTACRRPRTDIVATNTEDVGDFEVQKAIALDSVAARVCVANPDASDEIASRIVQQLSYQHYKSITLDLYSPARPAGRYIANRGEVRRADLPAGPNPCEGWRAAAENLH